MRLKREHDQARNGSVPLECGEVTLRLDWICAGVVVVQALAHIEGMEERLEAHR